MLAVIVCLLVRSFQFDTDYYVPVEEIQHTEAALGRS
ncbi:MAG: cytochrome aa3 quinol oxidase subunit, partial [Bacilli bacterium]|nr:cytochrome aa3 quinol oxidase subunit [Bacilli bacterium]